MSLVTVNTHMHDIGKLMTDGAKNFVRESQTSKVQKPWLLIVPIRPSDINCSTE